MAWLVTGLPRSRTAWFAVACGGLHEPISREGWDAFRPIWKADPDLGVSDAGAGMHLVDILKDIGPRTLIVERPEPDVILSLRRYVGNAAELDIFTLERTLTKLRHQLGRREVLDSPLVKRVPYHALYRPAVMRACMDHLGLDPPNLDQTMRMRIESDLHWNLRFLSERAA